MDEKNLARTLFLKSIEEEDSDGALLPKALRREVSVALGGGELPISTDEKLTTDEEAFLGGRSAELLGKLPGDSDAVADLEKNREGWLSALGIGLVLVALLGGFAMNRLANGREFNVLSSPFLGIVLWNLVVFGWLILKATFWRAERARGLGGKVVTLLDRAQSKSGEPKAGNKAEGDLYSRAHYSFQRNWFALRFPSLSRRMGMWFHLAAAAMAVGAVSSLYLRGLVTKYGAVWESTFLSKDQGELLIRFLYAPASKLLGGWPEEDVFAALSEVGGAPAARWIHLGALTLALLVILPRLLLAGWSWWSARRAWTKRKSEIAEESLRPYLTGLQKDLSGSGDKVMLVIYGKLPDVDGMNALEEAASDVWGGGVELEILPSVAYGMEDEFLQEHQVPDKCLLVYPLNATPEAETHGYLAKRLVGQGKLVAVLDGGTFEKKFSGLPEYPERLSQRLQAWRTILGEAGIDPILLGGEPSHPEIATTNQ